MIIIRLKGGLGNQLFQYAIGRALAEKRNSTLGLDTTFLKKRGDWTPRRYELGAFNIKTNHIPFLSHKLIEAKYRDSQSKLDRFLLRLPLLPFVEEKHYHFAPDVLNSPSHVHLDGYWQSPLYFNAIRPLLLNELTLKRSSTDSNLVMEKEIQAVNSVSIHIRRGDYVNSSFHPICPLSYYEQAIKHMAEKVKAPVFFVFSDDMDWVKENLLIKDYKTVYVNHNADETNYEDLHLMSLCKHQVTANSSFSWWGAWLNRNKNKTVISPKRWFADPSIDVSTLIPTQWTRL